MERQWIILIATSCLWILQLALGQNTQCPHPAVPIYASVALSKDERLEGTTVTYSCDEGYELFGDPMRTCSPGGKWSGEIPHCAVNVAYGKPSNQSSTVRGGEARNANDGDTSPLHEGRRCTETRSETSPWWQVDLLRAYPVRVVRLVARACCGHQPLQDLEIRVGNSSTVQGNRLCAWYPRTLDDGTTKDFPCAYPIVGRYVYVQIVGIQGSLSLCEAMVFTTQEISSGRCGNQLEQLELTTFSRTCYEFVASRGGSFEGAGEYCGARGGLLLHNVRDLTHSFVASELERRKEQLKSKLVWLGAQRDSGLRARTWHWVDGEPVQQYLWAEDQPNNYNGQQNCVVLDGGRRWLYNDVTCDLDYLPWVCQYNPSNCGSPDLQENSTVTEKDFRIGQSVTYRCPIGSKIVGDGVRKCDSTGFWTGSAPSCQHVDCGALEDIEFGLVKLEEERTTFAAPAHYQCLQDYTLVGEPLRMCGGDGAWNGTEPECRYHWCPALQIPINATLEVEGEGRKAGDTARYACARGHKLEGDSVRTCELGGTWTGIDPTCKFVECGVPSLVGNGSYQLIDGEATTFLSRVAYRCLDNFTLEGGAERSCLETGKWSGRNPRCNLISCGEPGILEGSEIVQGSSFTVHSDVRLRCKAGHKMTSAHSTPPDIIEDTEEIVRHCQTDGRWSGTSPTCVYVDCGRAQPPLRGEIRYPNGSTHLGSSAAYSCSPGFRLVGGQPLRLCGPDAKWTGSAPKCEEVRCVAPEVPRNATAVFGNNDRTSADSFRVGSTVQYRCAPGHLVQGEPLRTCSPIGHWNPLQPPTCIHVDCGLPLPVPKGHWMLPSNSTHYGAQTEYVCNTNYQLHGARRRLCLENATWSGGEPSCQVVSCGEPKRQDIHTTVEGSSFVVERMVHYSCALGYSLEGNATRTCLGDGRWSGDIPFCILVDCGTPSAVLNGQGFLANGTTTFESLVQYRCLPEFQMVGEPTRSCLASGQWSNLEPKCIDIVLDAENTADGRYADGQEADASKTIGIAIAVGAGAVLIIIIIVAVICMKTRRAKVLKSNGVRAESKEGATATTLRAFPRLEPEPGAAAPPVRSHPNGLVTFGRPSSPPTQQQPIYANLGRPTTLRDGVLQSESL